MKTTSSSAERSILPRDFGILDSLVSMLAVALFAAWILGSIFLYLFPAGANSSADLQTVALVGSADSSTNDPAATGTQGSDNGTASVNDAGDSNGTNATDGTSSSNQLQSANGLSDKEKSTLERKISTLQKQLDTKSKELTQLRKTSTKSAKPDPTAAANASKYKKEISQLKREKGQLDREIKKLKDQVKTQKTKIQTLQDQLIDVTQANSMAEATNAGNAEQDLTAIGGALLEKQPLEFRDWISSKGNKARLAFVRWEDGDIIVVNESNKTFRLTLNRLSPEDQKYVNGKR